MSLKMSDQGATINGNLSWAISCFKIILHASNWPSQRKFL